MLIIAHSKNSIHVQFLSSPSFLPPALFWNRIDVCDVDLILSLLCTIMMRMYVCVCDAVSSARFTDKLVSYLNTKTFWKPKGKKSAGRQKWPTSAIVLDLTTCTPLISPWTVCSPYLPLACFIVSSPSCPTSVASLCSRWGFTWTQDVKYLPGPFWKHAVESVSYWDWFNTSLNLECEILITTQMKKGSSLAKKKLISCIISIVRMNMMPNIHYL